MDVTRSLKALPLAIAAALLALLLVASPAAAVDEPVDDAGVEQTAEEGGRPAVAETPRQQLGLLLYAALALFLVGGLITVGRQLKGERPQATGEFRWR